MSAEKLCEICEEPIVGRQSSAKTCSSEECRKEAQRQYSAEYHQANRARRAERAAARYQANRDAILAQQAEYGRKNSERIKARKAARYQANRDAILARKAEYNREYYREGRGRATQALYSAIKRCHVPGTYGYADDYGGQGIHVHERYRDGLKPLVDNLIEDIGLPGPGHQLDRVDGTRGYEPGNLRWVTPRENALNRSTTKWLTHDGRTLCLADWARALGADPRTLGGRLRSGWPVEKALSTPVNAALRRTSNPQVHPTLPS